MNHELFQRAASVLVGGVSSSWNAIPGGPIYFTHASEMTLWDTNGNEYIDYMSGHSSLMFGHTSNIISNAISEAMSIGFGCQCETEKHIQLAELLCESIPCAEKVRFANTGSEVTMNAIRLARAHTKRPLIIKFEGNFHGLYDYVLFSTDGSKKIGHHNSDGTVEHVHGSSGIPNLIDKLTIVLEYNDIETFSKILKNKANDIAAVILEPIAFNLGCVKPSNNFLKQIRQLTNENGIILIFDEMLTGFRTSLGGAQEYYDIIPDLACFGKAFGAGSPITALVGKNEIMNELSPIGDSIMSGTNTGRWLSVLVALATLKEYKNNKYFNDLKNKTCLMIDGLRQIFAKKNIPVYIDGWGGLVCIYFGMTEAPLNLKDVYSNWNRKYNEKFYQHMLHNQKVYGFALPSIYHPERITITFAHSINQINKTLEYVDDTINSIPYFEN